MELSLEEENDLRDLLDKAFNLNELYDLSERLGIDHETVAPNQEKLTYILQLVGKCKRKNGSNLGCLLSRCAELRPTINLFKVLLEKVLPCQGKPMIQIVLSGVEKTKESLGLMQKLNDLQLSASELGIDFIYSNRYLSYQTELSNENKHVLVVEDSDDWGTRLKRIFDSLGCHTTVVSNANDAMERLAIKKGAFSLITIDLKLHGDDENDFSGIKFLKELSIKKITTPSLLISNYLTSEALNSIYDSGIESLVWYLDKKMLKDDFTQRIFLREILGGLKNDT